MEKAQTNSVLMLSRTILVVADSSLVTETPAGGYKVQTKVSVIATDLSHFAKISFSVFPLKKLEQSCNVNQQCNVMSKVLTLTHSIRDVPRSVFPENELGHETPQDRQRKQL